VSDGDDAPAAAFPLTTAATVEAEAKAAWQREKLLGNLPRLPTISLQPKVANSVSASVHLQRTPDG
jgi:hypothetical protein